MTARSDDELRALSMGEVRTTDAWNLVTLRPAVNGLYCERIFGAVSGPATVERLTHDTRTSQWGHVELPVAVARGDGSLRSVVLVVPPGFRPFVWLEAEAHRAWWRARREALRNAPEVEREDDELFSTDAEIEALGPGAVEPPLSLAYHPVLHLSARLRALLELDAPEPVLAELQASLVRACARLDEAVRAATLPSEVAQMALG